MTHMRLAQRTQLHPDLPPVCRLGLATRGNTRLDPADVRWALDQGVNYWNWCAYPDGMSEAVARLRPRERDQVVLAAQIDGRTATDMERNFTSALRTLATDRLDVVTLYYVESEAEWDEITGPRGALEYLTRAKEAGTVRLIGLTSHQRALAAGWARSGLLDLLMIRYNAAHRRAELDVFPTTTDLKVPVIAFTGLRWGALLRPTPDDPPGFIPPTPAECYRFMLARPEVAIALTAPNGRAELEANLAILQDWQPLSPARFAEIQAHGDRVYRHGEPFI